MQPNWFELIKRVESASSWLGERHKKALRRRLRCRQRLSVNSQLDKVDYPSRCSGVSLHVLVTGVKRLAVQPRGLNQKSNLIDLPMIKKVNDANLLLGDLAYESVREAILANDLKPGERVSEYKVAEWLGISRTPAREGLRRLENEGLLSQHPRRGLVVASIDDNAVQELYAVRQLLEGAAAAMAAKQATDAEVATLQHLVEAEARITEDPQQMYEHNRAFHEVIYRAAHNQLLLKFLLLTADTLTAYRNVSTLVIKERRDQVVAEHRELSDAIARRDEAAAKEIAVRHVQNALRARTKVQHTILIDEVRRRSIPKPIAKPPRH